MPCTKIVKLVMGIRSGQDVNAKIYKIFQDDFELFQELEFYQDFEWLKKHVINSIIQTCHDRSGFIYVAEVDGDDYVKVGRTKNIEGRQKSLNTSGVLNHLTITSSFYVHDAPLVEKMIHDALKRKCPKKKEFFLGHLKNITSDVETLIRHLEADFNKKLSYLGSITDPGWNGYH